MKKEIPMPVVIVVVIAVFLVAGFMIWRSTTPPSIIGNLVSEGGGRQAAPNSGAAMNSPAGAQQSR